jgi:tRNA A37 methylthiotransferase MiaB
MEEDLNLRRKAELIVGGPVAVPSELTPASGFSRSTAGPSTGNRTLALSLDGHRVTKSIEPTGEFAVVRANDRMALMRGNETFCENVSFEPIAYHCPGQAFFNLDSGCKMGCLFCRSPMLRNDERKWLTDDALVEMVRRKRKEVHAVALTSGVSNGIEAEIERMASCARRMKTEFPELPLGVEPLVDDERQLIVLRNAGADEIKINIQTADRAIFEKVCPHLSYDNVLSMISKAAELFGKGKVASNIIVGLGETDRQVADTVETLASMGAVAGIRALRHSADVDAALISAIGPQPITTAERLIRLAHIQKDILSKHALDTLGFHTMCFECTCCDLVPFRDL